MNRPADKANKTVYPAVCKAVEDEVCDCELNGLRWSVYDREKGILCLS